MEGNRDAAYKCIENAQKALDAPNLKNIDNVKKLLNKAKRLYPTQEAEDLMVLCVSWTNDEHVKRILRCKNHYDILQVRSDADDNEIKTSYNKLVLFVHPDKNRAYIDRYPARKGDFGNAFQKIKDAKAFLSDSLKQNDSKFDRPNAGSNTHSNTKFDTDFNDYPTTDSDDNDEPIHDNPSDRFDVPLNPEGWWNTKIGYYLLIFSPVILLLLGALFLHVPNTMNAKPIFRFERTPLYVIRRRTLSGKIPYYVTRDFKADVRDKYQGSMKELEVDVKTSYQKHLTEACNRERKQLNILLDISKSSGNMKLREEALLMGTPSCDELELLNDVFNCNKTWFSIIFENISKFLSLW